MKRVRQTTPIVLVTVLITAVAIIALKAPAGSLDPTAAPGSTMHTLDEIYANTLKSGTVVVPPEAVATLRGKSYLWAESIPGESTDDSRQDWIDIFGFEYDLNQVASTVGGAGGTTPRVDFSELKIIKQVDKASPLLTLRCCNGERINKVNLETTRLTKDGTAEILFRVELEHVIVSGVSPRFVYTGADYVLVEEVTLNFGKIRWVYSEYDPKGNSQEHEAAWDLMANVEI